MAYAFTRSTCLSSNADPRLSEEDVKRLASRVPKDKSHVQIIAVGQTGMGKTTTANRLFGTMAPTGRPGQGSITKAVHTYTRSALLVASDTVPFQLSFTDTPGLGDSDAELSDNDVCKAIIRSIKRDAAVFIIYFIRAGEKQNREHIAAIEEFEKATGKKIDVVVLTNVAKLPDFDECSKRPVEETFEDLRQELLSRWTLNGLRREYEEYLHEEEGTCSFPDIRVFDRKADGSPWSKKMKQLVIQMHYRQENRRGFKQWFRRSLNRPHLPVLKIENSIDYDERGKFGMNEFQINLGQVFKQRLSFYTSVFSLMTMKAVTATKPDETVIQVAPMTMNAVTEKATKPDKTVCTPLRNNFTNRKRSDEEFIMRMGSRVPRDKRHIQIIAVGQTGMGKTMTVNRTVGAMAAVGRPGQGSITNAVNNYTRSTLTVANDVIPPFQLTFTDTPGLGDSEAKFPDEDICFTIKKSIKCEAAAFIIYFIKTGEKQNRRHITAIEKLEKATGREIDAVVMTNATKLPDFGECSEKPAKETFEELRQRLLLQWTSKGLLHEYAEYLHEEEETESLPDIRVFDRKADGSPWTLKMKKLAIRMYYRQENRLGFEQWFRRSLNRPNLPVLNIENKIGLDERGTFGMLQFHTKLGKVFDKRSPYFSCVFSLMTMKFVTENEKMLDFSAIEVFSPPPPPPPNVSLPRKTEKKETPIITIKIEAPKDESPQSTKDAREESSKGILKRAWNWLVTKATWFFKR